MSILGRLKNMLVEKIVEDEFYQPITEAEVYAILNKKGPHRSSAGHLKLPHTASSLQDSDALAVADSVSQHTPELEFRMLGYEPSVEVISLRAGALKGKLQVIDGYLLEHYSQYMESMGRSLESFEEGREFFSTRRKVGEARFMLEKMSRLLSRSKTITQHNITIKNLRNTLKLLEKVPNIKKMGLLELKAIDLQRLDRTNEEVQALYGGRLLCLTNLSKYILKVNQESFNYIINNIKMCFDGFDDHLYEEVMRSYLIIQPPVALDQLLASFLEERVRTVLLDGNDSLNVLGNRLIALMINLHKIIKWHIINRALKNARQSSESEGEPKRRLSVSSNNSEDAPTTIELNQIVYISLEGIKEVFNRSVDSCLTDLATDNILSVELDSKEVYMHLYLLARIGEICSNFTGRRLEKLRKAFIQYFNRGEAALFAKSSRELVASIEQERSDWNRLAFPNNFRFVPVDRLLYRWTRMQELDEHRRVVHSVNRLFSEDAEQVGKEENESSEQQQDEEALELKIVKLDSSERLEKRFEEWNPKEYLTLYEGDAIVCQSSYKLLGVLERYTQFLLYAPTVRHAAYLEHMLLLIEYTAYFIFSSLLSSKYRTLFFEPIRPDTPLEKAYTLKRFRSLYPYLTAFVTAFRSGLEHSESSPQAGRLFAAFRKEIREASGEENQVLRAKIVAIDSCKYCLAYFHQVLKASGAAETEAGGVLLGRVEEIRNTLQDLCVLLLTESCQNILGLELQTIRSLFQSIRWYEAYEDLREYVQKIVGIVRESLERLKGCHRGEIPLAKLHSVFVFVWRTVLTYSVKLFLQGKSNNRRDCKLNFEKFVDDLYLPFEGAAFPALPAAYTVFKSIFRILLSADWEECRGLLVDTLRKFDYIYPILTSLLEKSEHMSTLSDKEKESRRAELREEIELLLKGGK